MLIERQQRIVALLIPFLTEYEILSLNDTTVHHRIQSDIFEHILLNQLKEQLFFVYRFQVKYLFSVETLIDHNHHEFL